MVFFTSAQYAERHLQEEAKNLATVENFCEMMASPERFEEKKIRLRATAHVLYGGILLESEKCDKAEATLHYMHGYEERSNPQALRTLKVLESKARRAALQGTDRKAGQSRIELILEGRLDKNPYYHLEIDRGSQTLMAWDYHYPYAFVVTRIIEAGEVKPG
jgi:hypothetical protein